MEVSQLPLTQQAFVKPEYLDSLKHMNVMWYTHYFDQATWEFFIPLGFGRDYHQGGYGGFAVEQHTRYLAELREGDEFSIFTRALGRSAKRFHFMHFLVRDREKVLSATSELLGIHVNMSTRRSAPMPQHLTEAWDKVIAEHNELDWDAPVSESMSP